MIPAQKAGAVVRLLAAVLADHRDDFENDEDFQRMIDLVAVAVVPLGVSWAQFMTMAQRQTPGREAERKHEERLRKRARAAGSEG